MLSPPEVLVDDSVAGHVRLTRGGGLIHGREVRLDLAQGPVDRLRVRGCLRVLRYAGDRSDPCDRLAWRGGGGPRCGWLPRRRGRSRGGVDRGHLRRDGAGGGWGRSSGAVCASGRPRTNQGEAGAYPPAPAAPAHRLPPGLTLPCAGRGGIPAQVLSDVWKPAEVV